MSKISTILLTIAISISLDLLASSTERIGAQKVVKRGRQARRAITPYTSKDIKSLLSHVTDPKDQIQIYSLWVDSLSLRMSKADQDLLAGTITKTQYDDYSNQVAKEIKKVANETKKMGFRELADTWETLAFQYTRTMANLLEE